MSSEYLNITFKLQPELFLKVGADGCFHVKKAVYADDSKYIVTGGITQIFPASFYRMRDFYLIEKSFVFPIK